MASRYRLGMGAVYLRRKTMAKNSKDLHAVGLDLTGKVAIVTGSGRGIGRAIAKTLAKAGADVCITARSKDQIESVKAEIIALGSKAIAVPCDVRDRAQVDHVVDTCVKELGTPYILVVNQGMLKREPTVEVDLKTWDDIFAVNVRGDFNFIQSAGKYMTENEYIGRVRGKVITISSIYGLRGGKGAFLHYQATKGAIIAMTRSLAMEWAKYDINVNCIAPGTFLTAINSWKDDPPEEQRRHIEARIPIAFGKKAPINPDNDPELIGTMALYFASPASDFTTGQIIAVDGGITEQF